MNRRLILYTAENAVPDAPRNPFRGVKLCKPKKPIEPVYANRFFEVLSESISQSTLIVYFQHQWQGWANSPKRRSLTLAQIKGATRNAMVRPRFVAPLP